MWQLAGFKYKLSGEVQDMVVNLLWSRRAHRYALLYGHTYCTKTRKRALTHTYIIYNWLHKCHNILYNTYCRSIKGTGCPLTTFSTVWYKIRLVCTCSAYSSHGLFLKVRTISIFVNRIIKFVVTRSKSWREIK